MTIKDEVYILIKNSQKDLSVSDIQKKTTPTNRTYISKMLSELVKEGKITPTKIGRKIFYRPVDTLILFEENLNLKNLDENSVWLKIKNNLTEDISEKTENALYFAFTEMLNNAIDHSKSGHAYTKIWQEKGQLCFIIRDRGIGVFNSLISKKSYADEIEAIQELVKGKVTTAPKWHSGEGIFWTSKISDQYSLTSYNYRLEINNEISDYSIKKLGESEKLIGTEVEFRIKTDTEKSLMDIFKTFSLNHDNYSFDTTFIPVKLFEAGEVWISRSQAKRVLQGLEKYQKIIMDFSNIEMVGQGFADEIFRVYKINHPKITIEPINMSESVRMMVERAESDQTGR